MKLSRYKILLIAPSIILTSCGYGLKETYNGVPYNSPIFKENYYNVWNKAINPYSNKSSISKRNDEKALNDETDLVFTSFEDGNFRKNEPHWSEYLYGYDINDLPEESSVMKKYGPSVKLSNYDDSFKYGVASKLFDGQMFCNGHYQLSRTQVEPTNNGEDKGFGVLFSKECNDASYLMLNFKCSIVGEDGSEISRQESNLKLKIGLYTKNDQGYEYIPLTYCVNNVPTNSGDGSASKRIENYTCFGFNLASLNLSRLIGFSFQYEKVSDTYTDAHPEAKSQHAVMLYEVSFPNTTWH